jgi:hypothetical protein
MPEIVTIPISFLELEAEYEHPDFKLSGDRTLIVQAIFDALKPWGIEAGDVEILTAGKLSEQGISFRIPAKNVVFSFFISFCKLSRDNVNWEMADETLAILNAAVFALTLQSRVVIGKKKASIGLHVQPKATTFLKVLSPFMDRRLEALESQSMTTMALVARWGKRKITLDGSATIANALFVKLEREFEPSVSFEEIALQLRTDEHDLFDVLGIEEDA